MSDPRDEQVVMENGIRLHYRMDAERFPIPTPTFRLRSEREDPTHVRLALPFPDGLTSDDIGLHPDYDADGWAIEDGELVFERSIAAGEECETLFGVKGIDEGTEFPLDAVSIEVLDAVEAGTEPERSTELGHIGDLVDGRLGRVPHRSGGRRRNQERLVDQPQGDDVVVRQAGAGVDQDVLVPLGDRLENVVQTVGIGVREGGEGPVARKDD